MKFKKRSLSMMTLAVTVSVVLAPFQSVFASSSSSATPPSTSSTSTGSSGTTSASGASGVSSSSTNQATSMAQDMVSFLKNSSTTLNFNNLSQSDYYVYGAFLSNFFVPWSTEFGALNYTSGGSKSSSSNSSAVKLADELSSKFFGSTAQAANFGKLNEFLYKAMDTQLNTPSGAYTLYADSNHTKILSGQALFDKIAGTDSDSNVYSSTGQAVLNVDNSATRASLQVLFGLNPNYMLKKGEGLDALNQLYMDGLGNIWGSYSSKSTGKGESISADNLVLFMPSALNPAVFDPTSLNSSSSPSNFKFPVANVFSMGGVLNFGSGGSNFRNINSSSSVISHIPYYNLKGDKYLPASQLKSATTILGIESPFSYIGNSNSLLTGKATQSNPESIVKSFLNQNVTSGLSPNDLNVLVTVDPSKSQLDTSLFSKSGLSNSGKETLWSYFLDSSVLNLGQVADDMYYFPVNGSSRSSSAGGAGYTPSGSFSDVSETGGGSTSAFGVYTQKLFAAENNSGSYSLYSNAYGTSPFDVFLEGYMKSTSKTAYLNNHGIHGSSSDMKTLENFLDTGTWNTTSYSKISSAMKLLTDGNAVFNGLLEAPNEKVRGTGSGLIGGLKNYFGFNPLMGSAFALSSGDTTVTDWSLLNSPSGAGRNSPYGKMFSDQSSGLTSTDKSEMATDFYNFMTYRIFSMDSYFTGQLSGDAEGTKFSSPVGGSFTLATPIDSGVNDYPGIYWGYMVQMLGVKPDPSGSGWAKPIAYSNNYLPPVTFPTVGGGTTLDLGSSGAGASGQSTLPSEANMEKAILADTYSLLSPNSSTYRNQLVKATQDSWIVSTHEAIVGESPTNNYDVSAGANGSYASVVGYINTPSLSALPLTQWLLSNYVYIYMLMLLFSLMLAILMVMTNTRSLRDGALVVLAMSFILILPQFLVGNVIGISNSIGNKIFSNKFNYWAIIQQQEALDSAQSAQASSNSLDSVIQSSMQSTKNTYSTSGVRLKWMAPKTSTYFDSMFGGSSSQGGLQSFALFKWIFSSYLTQTQYVFNNPLADYAYIPYNTISTDANNSYQAMSSSTPDSASLLQSIYTQAKSAAWVPDYRFSEFNPSDKNSIKYSSAQQSWIQSTRPSLSTSGQSPSPYRYWPLMDKSVTSTIFSTSYTQDNNVGVFPSSPPSSNYDAFTYTTESPFYYFYNVFESKYNSNGQSFKASLLDNDLYQSQSSNPKVSGDLKDFLDMKGLFTYVIPYLEQSNTYVYGYTNIHGTSVSGYNFGSGSQPPANASPQVRAQYLAQQSQKKNLQGVWDLYSPWVDQLYSLNVMDQRVGVAGKEVSIADSLNPGAYQTVGRDMIFSPAGMYAKGYNYSDLSDVERRIQQVERNTEKDMMYLTNYYDFNNQVLVTAAAMDATFNFDREFSQTRYVGTSTEIYPQNFELKDFNYDAFMRLVLLNSTGESIMQNKNLYAEVLANTSIFTGIVLLICDIFGVFIVPTMKIATLLLLFFLSFAISISCVVTPPEKLFKTLLKHLGLPSLYFILSTGVFAFVISMFMGDGLSGYVGSRSPSLGVSDPTIMMVLMLVADGAYMFVLWKIIRMLFRSLKSHATSSFFGTLGLAAGAGVGVLSSIKNGVGGALNTGVNLSRRAELLSIRGVGDSVEEGLESDSGGSGSRTDSNDDSSPRFSSSGQNDDFVKGSEGSKQSIDSAFRDEIDDLASNRVERTRSSRSVGRSPAPSSGAPDSSFTDNVNNLASNSNDVSQGEKSSGSVSRSVGKKFVDAKLAAKNAPSNIKDGVSYVTSKNGLAKDALGTAKEGSDAVKDSADSTVKDTSSRLRGVRTNFSNYASDMRGHEIDKETERLNKLDSKKAYASDIEGRKAKGELRIKELKKKQDWAKRRRELLSKSDGDNTTQ